MKKAAFIFKLLLFAITAQAQVSFKTIVPQMPVVSGESFQVQYIIEDGDKTMNVKPPEAMRPGKFIVPGATIVVNGKLIRSNDAMVLVISKEEAVKRFNKENGINNSDYFLRPGENGCEKIRQNLFVKVMVDRKNCYVGEPVLATFKLYSRLESKSDIIKNPGF